jgi:hypothetical protein
MFQKGMINVETKKEYWKMVRLSLSNPSRVKYSITRLITHWQTTQNARKAVSKKTMQMFETVVVECSLSGVHNSFSDISANSPSEGMNSIWPQKQPGEFAPAIQMRAKSRSATTAGLTVPES